MTRRRGITAHKLSLFPAIKVGSVVTPFAVKPPRPMLWGRVIGDLPARNPEFVGREVLLERMRTELRGDEHAPLVLHGLRGVGKTQIARRFIELHEHEYEVVWWVPADGAERANSALVSLGRRLQVPIQATEELTASAVVARLETERRPYLLVFDDVQDTEIRKLFPRIGGNLIVTTRNPAWAHEYSSIGLQVPDFALAEAVRFLRILDGRLTERQADRLVQEFGRLPLVLEQIAAFQKCTGQGWEQVRRGLEQLDRWAHGAAEPFLLQAWTASLSLDVTRLSSENPAAALVYELFAGLGPHPLSIDLLRTGCGGHLPTLLARTLNDPIQLRRAILDMSRFGLIRLHFESQRIEIPTLTQRALRTVFAPEALDRARRYAQQIREEIAGRPKSAAAA